MTTNFNTSQYHNGVNFEAMPRNIEMGSDPNIPEGMPVNILNPKPLYSDPVIYDASKLSWNKSAGPAEWNYNPVAIRSYKFTSDYVAKQDGFKQMAFKKGDVITGWEIAGNGIIASSHLEFFVGNDPVLVHVSGFQPAPVKRVANPNTVPFINPMFKQYLTPKNLLIGGLALAVVILIARR